MMLIMFKIDYVGLDFFMFQMLAYSARKNLWQTCYDMQWVMQSQAFPEPLKNDHTWRRTVQGDHYETGNVPEAGVTGVLCK